MTHEGDRRVWAALVFASGVADVIGAVRGSPRLHWTQGAARKEAEKWAAEMNLGPLVWENPDDEVALGRARGHVAVVRGVLLPLVSPEEQTS